MLRRIVQSILALGLCVLIASTLGGLYVIGIVIAIAVAATARVYILAALALGLLWPVVALAYVIYVTRGASSRQETERSAAARVAATTGKPGDRRIEDPQ